MDGVSLDSNGVEETYDESYVNLHPSVFRVGDNTISLGYPTSYLITEVVFDNPEISGGRGREYYGGKTVQRMEKEFYTICMVKFSFEALL